MATVQVTVNGMKINDLRETGTLSQNLSFYTLGRSNTGGLYNARPYDQCPLGIELTIQEIDAIRRANLAGLQQVSLNKSPESGAVNQDASLIAVVVDPITQKTYNFGAVADGLGGASGEQGLAHRGSRLAVLAAFKVMNRLMTNAADPNHGRFREAFERFIAGDTEADAELMSIISGELGREFIEAAKKDYRAVSANGYELMSHSGYKMYGTTLSLVLLGTDGGISLQLGDGGVINTADGQANSRLGLDECDAPNTTTLGIEDGAFKAWVHGDAPDLILAPPRLTADEKPVDMTFTQWVDFKKTISPFSRAVLSRTSPGCAVIVATDGLEKLHLPSASTQSALDETHLAIQTASIGIDNSTNDAGRAEAEQEIRTLRDRADALHVQRAFEIGESTAAQLVNLTAGGMPLVETELKDDTTYIFVPVPKSDGLRPQPITGRPDTSSLDGEAPIFGS